MMSWFVRIVFHTAMTTPRMGPSAYGRYTGAHTLTLTRATTYRVALVWMWTLVPTHERRTRAETRATTTTASDGILVCLTHGPNEVRQTSFSPPHAQANHEKNKNKREQE